MTIGSIQDRRQFAQEQLAAMTSQIGTEHPETLRALATSVLFAPATNGIIAVDREQHTAGDRNCHRDPEQRVQARLPRRSL